MKLQKYKRDSDVSYAMGATLVAELIKTHPHAITRVFLRPADKYGDDLKSIVTDLKSHNVEIIESTKAFNILGAKDNCLLMAEFKKRGIYGENKTFNATPSFFSEIALVHPSDSGNLGTIMRSAAAFGFNYLTIVEPAIDPYDPKVIRASMGAIFHLIIKTCNEDEYYEDIKTATHCTHFAFILNDQAQKLEEIPADKYRDECISLILGNEAAGLPKDFCERTGATPVYIKQSEYVDSLNLGVAASIAMHHFAN
jgi:TrmH family RNA methyltransferase